MSVIDPGDWASRQMVGTEDPSLSFEDKRKENFEAGRMELDRRRRALQEQQEKIAVSMRVYFGWYLHDKLLTCSCP